MRRVERTLTKTRVSSRAAHGSVQSTKVVSATSLAIPTGKVSPQHCSSQVHVNFACRYTCLSLHVCRDLSSTQIKCKTSCSLVFKRTETTVRYCDSLSLQPAGAAHYLLRLYWASRNKLSKSMESYLLLVEAGSKSSEWESKSV